MAETLPSALNPKQPARQRKLRASLRQKRDARILALRARGMTYGEIVEFIEREDLGKISERTVGDVLQEQLQRASDELSVNRKHYWALALERLEQAIRLHQSFMLDTKLSPDQRGRAAERMVGVIARQAKMMGFDQNATLKLSDGEHSISMDIANMDDDQLAKEVKGFMTGASVAMSMIDRRIEASVERNQDDVVDATVVPHSEETVE